MTGRTGCLVVFLLVTGLPVMAAPTVAAEAPSFTATASDPVLVPGATQQVTITVENDAVDPDDVVETARDVSLRVRAGDAPLDVRSGPRDVGSLGDGERVSVTVSVEVPADASAGSHALPVTIRYIDGDGDRRTTTVTATVSVEDRPRFALVETKSNLSAGTTGRLAVTLENVGSATASDVTVALRSRTPALRIDGGQVASRAAGTLSPGETVTVSYDVTPSRTVNTSKFAVLAVASYTATDGDRVRAVPMPFGVTPRTESTIDVVDSRLTMLSPRAGLLAVDVRNVGTRPLEALQVTLQSRVQTVRVRESTVAVGDLPPGETATLTARVSVAPDTAAGTKPFLARASYDDGTSRSTDVRRFHTVVNTSRRMISITPVAATFAPDTTGQLRLRITNEATVALHDLRIGLRPEPPITSTTPRAFVDRLRPGESTVVTLGVTVDEDAVASTTGLTVNVTSETDGGWTIRSSPRQLPLVIEPAEGVLSTPTVIAVLVLVAVVGLLGSWWWVNR